MVKMICTEQVQEDDKIMMMLAIAQGVILVLR
ncbi:hypothetical protein TorRG33x02_307410 [Trema orientale]|uniref:Uncharacterized protein n=1 Tax=Trema orientale TaxID=63057 RepID=A0A2P5BVG4_TREOI|nr:hypothetical protein TorRG33x02_307410 [Trema orientale]